MLLTKPLCCSLSISAAPMLQTEPLCCNAGLKIVVGDEEQARRCQAKLQNLTFTDQALLSHGNRLLFFPPQKKKLKIKKALSLSLSLSPSLSLTHTHHLCWSLFVAGSSATKVLQQRCNRDAKVLQQPPWCRLASVAAPLHTRIRFWCCNRGEPASDSGAGSPLLQHLNLKVLQQPPWCRLASVAAPESVAAPLHTRIRFCRLVAAAGAH
jgi:hypothetical protein